MSFEQDILILAALILAKSDILIENLFVGVKPTRKVQDAKDSVKGFLSVIAEGIQNKNVEDVISYMEEVKEKRIEPQVQRGEKCAGMTKAGAPCKRNAVGDSNTCSAHSAPRKDETSLVKEANQPAEMCAAVCARNGKQCKKKAKKQGIYCGTHTKNVNDRENKMCVAICVSNKKQCKKKAKPNRDYCGIHETEARESPRGDPPEVPEMEAREQPRGDPPDVPDVDIEQDMIETKQAGIKEEKKQEILAESDFERKIYKTPALTITVDKFYLEKIKMRRNYIRLILDEEFDDQREEERYCISEDKTFRLSAEVNKNGERIFLLTRKDSNVFSVHILSEAFKTLRSKFGLDQDLLTSYMINKGKEVREIVKQGKESIEEEIAADIDAALDELDM